MVEMRFHWFNEKTSIEGTFTVESATIEDCIAIAELRIPQSDTLYFTDYYQI